MKTTGGGEEVDRGYSAGSIPAARRSTGGIPPGVFRREYSAAVSCSQGDSAASSRMKTREYSAGSIPAARRSTGGIPPYGTPFFFFFCVQRRTGRLSLRR